MVLELITLLIALLSITLTLGLYFGKIRTKLNIMYEFLQFFLTLISRNFKINSGSLKLTDKGLAAIPNELRDFLKSISHKFRKCRNIYEIVLKLCSKYGDEIVKYVNPEVSFLELVILCAVYINELIRKGEV